MESRGRGVGRVLAFVGSGIVVCTFALLIWAKLRMVTGVPRTAYADPNEQQQAQPLPPGAQTPGAQTPGVQKEKIQRRPARNANREALRQQALEAAKQTEVKVNEEVPVVGSGDGT